MGFKFRLVEDIEGELILYNSTNDENFDYNNVDFDKSNEIGIHCGSFETARSKGYRHINRLFVSGLRVCEMNDVGSTFGSMQVINGLYNSGIISIKERSDMIKEFRKEMVFSTEEKQRCFSRIIRNCLIQKGYNSVHYINGVENKGDNNYIIFDNAVVKFYEQIK